MDDAIRQDYAPTGTLRVALNHGNRVLVGRSGDGSPCGISVDLAHALAAAIGCPLQFVEFERAVDVSDAVTDNRWDVCFLAVDPKRAETIAFTSPYVRISGCYLVGANVAVNNANEVAGADLRIGVVDGSAYTLHLSRTSGAEKLVTMPDIFAALDALDAGEVDGIAGIERAMTEEALKRAGARVLQPPFMEIKQAMGMPASRLVAIEHLRDWLAGSIQNGAVGFVLERHGLDASCVIDVN